MKFDYVTSVPSVASMIRSPLANTISGLSCSDIGLIAAVISGLWSAQSKIIDERRMDHYEYYIWVHYEER